jgi:hypothetical protein
MTTTRKQPRTSQRMSSSVRAGPLDLGTVARQAVLSFLHDASIATAEQQATGTLADAASSVAPAENTVGGGAQETGQALAAGTHEASGDAGQNPSLTAESSAWQAAAISVDALDRIEAAAARVEADIASASQANAEMQAGAGAAVEAAVRSAQSAAAAADTAVQADGRASIALRRIEHYTTITIGILIIAIIILTITASSAH